ncbi:histidine phosphatase family protein [Paraglaciecola chathamensis]|uniref:Phosphoglycerate/bisphosphoglycerate mutase n=1 Tax=Paraglaciecola chathamensis S18K6 TaxID=1127672 RepID=A0AAV3V5W0_9ALTE|nr:histidine phosphatase family protein [Paraglaciecola chathamensis]GAC12107.1 phosphoglycerate/bisphosphoglycerate mutase [Paraglaciecola chathamensis S18K6]
MSEFYIVRHGQASFGAENYDKLSELGHQQSVWLGEYFAQRNMTFGQLWLGQMVRHQETAAGICEGLNTDISSVTHTGLNEFDFQNIAAAYLAQHPNDVVQKGAPPAEFYRLLKKAMGAWSSEQLEPSMLNETWTEFRQRVLDVLNAMRQQNHKKPILLVSSGGAISMLMSLVLELEAKHVIELNMQVRNASYSQFFFNRDTVRLSSFNNVPHLDIPERVGAVTFS